MKKIYLISGTNCCPNNGNNIHEEKSTLGLFLSELLSNLYGANVLQEFCSLERFYCECVLLDDTDVLVTVQCNDSDLEWLEAAPINRHTKILLLRQKEAPAEFMQRYPNTVALPMPLYRIQRKLITDAIGKTNQFRPTHRQVSLTAAPAVM